MDDFCATKYPVIMLHGVGIRELPWMDSWGRIPAALAERGAKIHNGQHDAWGSIESNAASLKAQIKHLVSRSGCGKVNIIAHSKGGLDARYMISALGMEKYVASLTTIATPHRGLAVMDKICEHLPLLLDAVAFSSNIFYKAIGDSAPDFRHVCHEFTTEYAEYLNIICPNSEKIYYQSYAADFGTRTTSSLLLELPHFLIKLAEGDNDGLVSVRSARWGAYRGIINVEGGKSGFSHFDQVDVIHLKRRGSDYKRYHSVTAFYINLLNELKNFSF
ncbi:MAG: alpha/beta hydrolase [Oscillospiraceae bacterium]|jgi:triacylglycerol lipase|nr:alpha/beta hydrolase [Oscillospiraceae bacterium]